LDEYVRYENDERVSETEVSFREATASFLIYGYLDQRAWLIEHILLAIPPPPCILDARASSRALGVTEASRVSWVCSQYVSEKGTVPSRSLKLLPSLYFKLPPSLS
jgi:hypothetical protein